MPDRIFTDSKFILSLSEGDLSLEDLSLLNGCVFRVRKEQSEWGKMVICLDKVVITNIKASVNLQQDKTDITAIHVYADFYLSGKFMYNAWTGLESIKNYIIADLSEREID